MKSLGGLTAQHSAFLSHLSGDEAVYFGLATSPYFLSHLSGDEVWFDPILSTLKFLSHLSGDEVR